MNNATCVDLVNDFKCNCQPGYKGRFCAVEINECENIPCMNNASCADLVNEYKCLCKPGKYL